MKVSKPAILDREELKEATIGTTRQEVGILTGGGLRSRMKQAGATGAKYAGLVLSVSGLSLLIKSLAFIGDATADLTMLMSLFGGSSLILGLSLYGTMWNAINSIKGKRYNVEAVAHVNNIMEATKERDAIYKRALSYEVDDAIRYLKANATAIDKLTKEQIDAAKKVQKMIKDSKRMGMSIWPEGGDVEKKTEELVSSAITGRLTFDSLVYQEVNKIMGFKK